MTWHCLVEFHHVLVGLFLQPVETPALEHIDFIPSLVSSRKQLRPCPWPPAGHSRR